MSQDPLLDKMDALLKKHRGSTEGDVPAQAATPIAPIVAGEDAPPPDAWLPVLTDLVMMGTVPPAADTETANAPEQRTSAAVQAAPTKSTPPAPPALPAEDSAPAVTDSLAEQLLGELEPQLAALLQDKVAKQIRNSLDETISALLAQLDVNIREIVRDAINEKLMKR
jgi:hypothetical protein